MLIDQLGRIIIGSCVPQNANRIGAAFEQNVEHVVVDSWKKFEQESGLDPDSIFLTDLNLVDGFPSVIFDKVQNICDKIPTIILLEDIKVHSLYRERAHFLLEILPLEAIENKNFVFLLLSSKTKIDIWSKHPRL